MIHIFEDDPDYQIELKDYLENSGFSVRCGNSIQDVSRCLGDASNLRDGDIVLLDLALKGGNAFEFIPQFCKTPAACIILTGNVGETERVIGLELGVDDYISKGASPREIAARIKTVLRRTQRAQVSHPIEAKKPGWRFDEARCVIHSPSGDRILLTFAEGRLFTKLVEKAGTAVSRQELTSAALNKQYNAADRTLDNLVARVRNKFRPVIGNVPIIKAARHLGYMFVGYPDSQSEPSQHQSNHEAQVQS